MKMLKETANFKLFCVDELEKGIEIHQKTEDTFGNMFYKKLFAVSNNNDIDKSLLQLFKEILE